jgi:Ca-activated chloride channel family protein
MQIGTAVGSAIVLSVAELFPDHHIDLASLAPGSGRQNGRSLDEKDKPPPKEITPVAPGSYNSAAIILLSDGRRTTGVDTLAAAKLAAERGVRIHVVGLGSANAAAGPGEELPIYLQLDEPTLREVARMTGGEYFHAGTAERLRSVYQTLGAQVQVMSRETEVAALLAVVSAVLALGAGGLSLYWFRGLG